MSRHSRASQSYDDLDTDHYAALNIQRSSRHGYDDDNDDDVMADKTVYSIYSLNI